jgi:protein O-GlcNAc transferase
LKSESTFNGIGIHENGSSEVTMTDRRVDPSFEQSSMDAASRQMFRRGLAAQMQGDLASAERIYGEVLQRQPKHFDALHQLGIVSLQVGRLERGVELLKKAIALNADIAVAHLNLGNALKTLKRFTQALESYDNAIALKPDYAEAFYNRASVLYSLSRLEDALGSYSKVIELKPDYADAYHNRGVVLKDLKRFEEALDSYDDAIALKPGNAVSFCNRGAVLYYSNRLLDALNSYDKAISLNSDYAEAYCNRGVVLRDLRRMGDAIASYDRAIALKPDYADAYNNRGAALMGMGRPEDAIASYDTALAINPSYAEAYNNRGNVLKDLNRFEDALACYDKALAIKPNYAEAHSNRGNVLRDMKRLDEALASYDKAIALSPTLAEAHLNRGIVLQGQNRFEESLASYDKALALYPDFVGLEGNRLHAKLQLCDWRSLDDEVRHLIAAVRAAKPNTAPFSLFAIPSSSADQLRCARTWVAARCPPVQRTIWQGEIYKHQRIHVGYVSADFRQHATSYLMAGLFECHDRSRFDITAISFSNDDKSEMLQRLKRSVERFIDVRSHSDAEIANLVKLLQVDILIDLKGFTADSRTRIFAHRAAPVQVNYLGCPGTMGASYIDYIIADQTLIPQEEREFYSEKSVLLPDSYQVNDNKRCISDKVFTRAEQGLPSSSFVFCCFNNNYKITPEVFSCWMRMLKRIDDSVLWLFEGHSKAADNLRREAMAHGVKSDRLIFARHLPLPEHLARHRLADLFLDTLPCNAHTTASDALWAGLPVLTCRGQTFAGRVAASLLNAMNLPELVTTSLESYERTAVDLATNPEKLSALKQNLADRRLTTPLFDTQRFAQHLETAYTAMYNRYQAGLGPDHLIVSPQ